MACGFSNFCNYFGSGKGYNHNRQDAKRGGNHHGALHPKKMLKSRIGGKQLRGTYHLLTGSSSSFFTYELFGSKESSTSGISGPYICAFVQGFACCCSVTSKRVSVSLGFLGSGFHHRHLHLCLSSLSHFLWEK
ncbi:uncharacterized protein [Malus domestica]|uniref:uncharacterized protein n=1 Tax=Malus domestica TaxID=3750 RepID=UPI003976F8CC